MILILVNLTVDQNRNPVDHCLVSLNVFKTMLLINSKAYVHLRKCIIYQDNRLSTKNVLTSFMKPVPDFNLVCWRVQRNGIKERQDR